MDDRALLNAVRFVDIPFLLTPNDARFSFYSAETAPLHSNTLIRYFALGVDYVQLLIASTQATDGNRIINGLTGTLTLGKSGQVKRQLSIARFTYDGLVLE